MSINCFIFSALLNTFLQVEKQIFFSTHDCMIQWRSKGANKISKSDEFKNS